MSGTTGEATALDSMTLIKNEDNDIHKPTLLNLPTEIRLMIYTQLIKTFPVGQYPRIEFNIARDGRLECRDDQKAELCTIRLVCKKVSAEFMTQVFSTSLLKINVEYYSHISTILHLKRYLAEVQLFRFIKISILEDIDFDVPLEDLPEHIKDDVECYFASFLQILDDLPNVAGVEIKWVFHHPEQDTDREVYEINISGDPKEIFPDDDRQYSDNIINSFLSASGFALKVRQSHDYSRAKVLLGCGIEWDE
jgi:hypothetical protein